MKEIKEKPVIAAFDFDGTLTDRDTLFYFLIHCFGFRKTVVKMIPLIPFFLLYAVGKKSRQQVKEGVLTRFFKGLPIRKIRQWGKVFAKREIPKRLQKPALEKLRWHQKQGHRCLLVSASLDVYLNAWSRMNGFETAITSRLEVDPTGNATGKLQGLNCRRQEKIDRLTRYLGPLDRYVIYAYGDSEGDRELLASATHPFYRNYN